MPRLRVQQCLQLVVDILGQEPAVLVIDAIDKIEETRRHVNALKQMVAQSTSVVKVFITSRNDSMVLTLVPDTQRNCVNSSDSRSDRETFAHNHLEYVVQSKRLLNGDVSESLREDLNLALLNSAGEMFPLQIESLCRRKT